MEGKYYLLFYSILHSKTLFFFIKMTYGLHQRGIDVLEVEELVEQLRDESSIGLKHLSRHKTEIRNQYLVISESSLIIASTL